MKEGEGFFFKTIQMFVICNSLHIMQINVVKKTLM
jgi:hypothetical protein